MLFVKCSISDLDYGWFIIVIGGFDVLESGYDLCGLQAHTAIPWYFPPTDHSELRSIIYVEVFWEFRFRYWKLSHLKADKQRTCQEQSFDPCQSLGISQLRVARNFVNLDYQHLQIPLKSTTTPHPPPSLDIT